jgi:tripartite-type tricarboxylate transporter receptor subunit TctC
MYRIATTAVAATVALGLMAGGASASNFPDRPITWIVPFTPGGITDTASRVIADELSKALGQTVTVENRPGAGGTVGTEQGARATADGYTVIYGTQGTIAAAPFLRANLRYDPLEDFVPIHGLASSHNIIVAYPDAPFTTINELVDYARENPGEVNFGSAGVSTASHLLMELFKQVADIEGVHVPYAGSAPAINDLLAGRVDVVFDYAASSADHVEAGTLRALATNGPERHPVFPDVPTLIEEGFPEATGGTFSMLFVPAGTPQDRIEILTRGMQEAMASDAVAQYLERSGSRKLDFYGEEAEQFVRDQTELWGSIIEAAGIEPQD